MEANISDKELIENKITSQNESEMIKHTQEKQRDDMKRFITKVDNRVKTKVNNCYNIRM